MKTQSWNARPSSDNGTTTLAVDAPCLMWGNGAGPIGPFPLALCMLKALQLVRTNTDFAIESETGDLLLESDGKTLRGEPRIEELFLRQAAMASELYSDFYAQIKQELGLD